VHDFQRDTGRGHLHRVRRGPVRLIGLGSGSVDIVQPALVLLPRPETHRLVADDRNGADVVCGTVVFGAAGRNPVADALPDLVQVPLAGLPGSEALLDLLFDEAFTDRCGRPAAVDRLWEVLLLRLPRHGMARGWAASGALTGLGDARLAPVLQALHDAPAVLSTYLHGYGLFRSESGLSPTEQEVVFLAASQVNGCDYCTAAHSMIAYKKSGVPAEALAAIRHREARFPMPAWPRCTRSRGRWSRPGAARRPTC
jgi:AhpD family alkylhydroperoxidase